MGMKPPNTAPLRGISDVHPIPGKERRGHGGGNAQRSCAWAGRCSPEAHSPNLRVFKQFAWLGVGSGKIALSRPAHQREPCRKHAGQAASRWAVFNSYFKVVEREELMTAG